MINVYFLLGSNLGNRELLLQQAVTHTVEYVGDMINKSAIYETQSWGKTDAPDYLNQVVELQTDRPAKAILEKILAIELLMGRKREEKWGARTIDIDILFYGDKVISEPGLIIPHPELHKRRFTLEPMSELAPHLLHPLLNKSILQLKAELKDGLIVKKL